MVSNRFLFTGREWLSQVGLYDYRNRVYSAQIGRFLQTDPIRFSAGDVNIYRYCGNEPLNWVDTYGLKVEVCSRTILPFDLGSHTWVKVTDSNGESTTYSGTKEGDNLGVKKNDPSDTKPDKPSGGVEVPPPDGLTQDQWDKAVKDSGEKELNKHNQRDYDPGGGDGGKKSGNCHSTTSDIIEGAGGKIPKYNPPGLNPGLRTE